jgi:hypothetical protein
MATAPVPVSGGNSSPYGGVSTPKIFSSANPATHVLLSLMLQTGGLVIVTTLAGLDDTVGNMMVLLMVGLLLLFMIMNADKFNGIVTMLTNVEQGAV